MKFFSLFIFFSLILTSLNLSARKPTRPFEIWTKRAQQKKIPLDNLGVWISGSRANVRWQADKAFIPASATKILTGVTALDLLGADTKFKTSLHINGENLCLKGGGDPSFVSESMWSLVNQFLRKTEKRSFNKVIVDESYFDTIQYPASRPNKRTDRAYDAPISALSFNWNSANIHIKPNSKNASPLKVFVDPISNYLKTKSTAKTTAGFRNSLGVSRKENTITVTGSLGIKNKEKTFYKNILEPALWAGHNLMSFAKQRNINFTEGVQKGICAGAAIAEYSDSDVKKNVAAMLKYSNNFAAEMLAKHISKKLNPSLNGEIKYGVEAIHKHLKNKFNFNSSLNYINNPSGYSRENKITPESLGQLLGRVQRNFSIYPEFLSALPVGGIDGTLKTRQRSKNTKGKVRAKTGLLNGVNALAGYLENKNGEVIKFVFFYNGSNKMNGHARDLFDQILIDLAEH